MRGKVVKQLRRVAAAQGEVSERRLYKALKVLHNAHKTKCDLAAECAKGIKAL